MTICENFGAPNFVDDAGRVSAIEAWKSTLERDPACCRDQGIAPVDLTVFSA